ncbi:MAG TPA: hypothetical protein VFJ77_02835 [Gaiellaceae bacterium]|nr:hypothetical protein [Gaiellaceae bacterium]
MSPEEHRALGVALYNTTWELLERGADPDEIVDAAHASAHHWRHAAGATAANRARSHWLCSHVYALLGRPEPARHHARRCLELVEAAPAEMAEFDLPGAYEALARAHAAAGEREEAARFVALGREAAARIADAEDREQLESQLATVLP